MIDCMAEYSLKQLGLVKMQWFCLGPRNTNTKTDHLKKSKIYITSIANPISHLDFQPSPLALALALQTSFTFDQQTIGSCKNSTLHQQINFNAKILTQFNNTIQLWIKAIKSTTICYLQFSANLQVWLFHFVILHHMLKLVRNISNFVLQ